MPDGKSSVVIGPGDRIEKAVRAKGNFLNGFNVIWVVQPSSKNIPLWPWGKSNLELVPSCPEKRGVGHRHERWGRSRWTRVACETNAPVAYGEVVWS